MTEQAAPLQAGVSRTSRRRAAGTVVAGLLLSGVPLGALWAWMAPAVHGVVVLTRQGDRVQDYLGAEPQHFFVAAALLLGLLSAVAVVAAALVWQWRPHRGPGMVVALGAGVLGAGSVAAAVGALLVHVHYGTVHVGSAPVTHDHPVYYFTEAPPVFFGHSPLQIACTLLLPVAGAALAYAAPVATTARDDLGGYPGAVIADAGAPSVR
jgi:MFS family permease